MNNKYDREPTHDEMKELGYVMTADGFWMNKEVFSDDELVELGYTDTEIEFDDMRPDSSVKLVLLKSGELLLTKYQEYTYSNKVKLTGPKVVISRSSASADGNVTTTIQYSQWMALSASEEFEVSSDYIVTVTDPIQSLYDSYLEGEF